MSAVSFDRIGKLAGFALTVVGIVAVVRHGSAIAYAIGFFMGSH